MLPEYHLTLAVLWSVQAECVVLFCAALAVAVHLVCTANFMPAGKAPAALWLPVSIGAGACVIVMHSAWAGRVLPALWSMLVVACCLAAMQVALWLRGYHVCAHLDAGLSEGLSASPCADKTSRRWGWWSLALALLLAIVLSGCAEPAPEPVLCATTTVADAPAGMPMAQDDDGNASSPAVGTLATPLVKRLVLSILHFLSNSSAVVEIKAGNP